MDGYHARQAVEPWHFSKSAGSVEDWQDAAGESWLKVCGPSWSRAEDTTSMASSVMVPGSYISFLLMVDSWHRLVAAFTHDSLRG
jgi:hypothetical protein